MKQVRIPRDYPEAFADYIAQEIGERVLSVNITQLDNKEFNSKKFLSTLSKSFNYIDTPYGYLVRVDPYKMYNNKTVMDVYNAIDDGNLTQKGFGVFTSIINDV